MTFSEILPFLNEGFAVSRDEYKESLIIFKQSFGFKLCV